MAAAALVATVLPGCQPDRLRQPIRITTGERDFPDPTVFYAQGEYHAYATTAYGWTTRNVQVMTSTDLYEWSGLTDALPVEPAWARPSAQGGAYWAPTVAKIGGRYVLYFAAKHRSTSADAPGWCIGYATSPDPGGPFTPGERPLLCQVLKHSARSALSTAAPGAHRGVIDPQVYLAPSGATYLHFKPLDNPYQLAGVALSSTGTSLRTDGYGMVQLEAKARTWEYSAAADNRFTVLENPSMDHNPQAPASHRFYLYYSGNDWRTASYGTGVAACESPMGPCFRATTEEPWLASRGTVRGPGGLSVFTVEGGGRWVAYHSWERGQPTSNGRRLHVEPLGYQGTRPVLLNRVPVGSFDAEVGQGSVTLRGQADDHDTGRHVEVILKEGSSRLATVTVDAFGLYEVTLPATVGSHRYCAFVVDDNGLGTRQIGCRTVEVSEEEPPASPSPSTSTSTSSTSVPPSSSSTSTSSTTSSTTSSPG